MGVATAVVSVSQTQLYPWGSLTTTITSGGPSNILVSYPYDIGVISCSIVQVSISNYNAYALCADGVTMYAYGDNTFYQVGDGTTTSRTAYTLITTFSTNAILSDSETVSRIIAGDRVVYFKTSTGRLLGLGDNTNGQLGGM